MYEPASLGMFQCRLQRILCDFEVIMFFRKDLIESELFGHEKSAFTGATNQRKPVTRNATPGNSTRIFNKVIITVNPAPRSLASFGAQSPALNFDFAPSRSVALYLRPRE